MTRVVSIGLDGAAWHRLDALIAEGRLPNLASLADAGVRAPLRSVTPPVTCPAWRCSTSGKNPGKLGVYWWLNLDRDDGEIAAPDADSFGTADVWDYLSDDGRRCAVLNVPMTYPPSPIEGAMVAGFGASLDRAADPEGALTWPPSFEDELREAYDWRTGVDDVTTAAGLERTYEVIRSRFELLLDVLKRDYDYLHLTVFYVNALQHKYGDAAETDRAWEIIDEYLGRIDESLERAEEDTLLLVYSDHGHGAIDDTFVINRWLLDRGYLSLSSNAGDSVTGGLYSAISSLGLSPKRLAVLARRALPGDLADRLIPSRYPISTLELAERVDWAETDAVAFSQGPLYLNRDRLGDRYESVRASLREELAGLTHEGDDVLERVRTAEEAYAGPYVDEAPDLLLSSAEGWEIYGGVVPSAFESQVMSWTSGNHPVGVFLANGPGVDAGELSERSLLDVAPTVLHALDSPVPEDFDGSVVREAVPNPDASVGTREPIAASSVRARRDDDLEQRLADVGYLE